MGMNVWSVSERLVKKRTGQCFVSSGQGVKGSAPLHYTTTILAGSCGL